MARLLTSDKASARLEVLRQARRMMPMFGDDILVRTLLLPPRPPRRRLDRERLDDLLSRVGESRLTVVSASAGYGKSTALTSFANQECMPCIWYTLGEGCDDPLV